MKRWIITAAVTLLLAGSVQAQTSEKKATQKQATTTNKTKAPKAKGAKNQRAVKVTSPQLNERRMYKADNGQRATPTGHEATPTSGGYASLKKDTAVVVPKEAAKTKKENKEQ